ncbi:CHAT domain-containing protein [Xylogone sp. PMI_703]|nr:CHAT domain-containing protein [Xylogone sp. PMI_703]
MERRVKRILIAEGRYLNLDDEVLNQLALALFQQNKQSQLNLKQETDDTWTLVIGRSSRYPLDAASFDRLAVVFHEWKEPPTDNYLNAAIECWSRSIALADLELLPRLLDICHSYRSRYNRRRQDVDLTYAIRIIKRAASIIKPSHPYYSNFLSIYGELACLDTSLLNMAISNFQKSRSLIEENPDLYQLYGNVLYCRYDRHNKVEDLKMAIGVSEEIVASTSSAPKTRLYALANLAQWYGPLHKHESQRNQSDQGVHSGLKAVEALNEGQYLSSDRAYVFGALAAAFLRRYEYSNKRADLDNSIQNGEEARRLATDTDPDKPKWLNNLGSAYEYLFEETGDMQKLEQAIESTETAFQLTPGLGPGKLHLLNNLANQFGRRYNWTYETEYLDHSIQKLEEAVQYEEQSAFERAIGSQNLGFAYKERFTRKRNPDDLNRSIMMFREAISHYTEGDPSVAQCHYLLGSVHELLYEVLSMKPKEELTKAKESYEKAKRLCQEDNPHRASILMGLGLFHARQFQKDNSNNIDDLNKGITLVEEACGLLPPDTPARGAALMHLGGILPMRFIIKKEPKDLTCGLEYYKEALEMPNAHPLIRIKAARFAIRLLKETEDWKEMKPLGETAMSILPFVCGRYQRLYDQQQALLHTTGLAADVCSILLKLGFPKEALRKLEFGRGLVIGYTIDNRDDLMALNNHPDLARKYDALRNRLYLSPDEPESRITESQMRERRSAAGDMEKCLEEIRQTEGNQDFLKELPIDQMMACAEDGPIVVVNVTDISSDAILISISQIVTVSLPDIKRGSIPDFVVDGITNFGPRNEVSSRDGELEVAPGLWRKSVDKSESLAWLWHACVKVVLDKLRATKMISRDGPLPHIWWIGSGVASSFPFHAAGSDFQNGEDALSQMIPSYAPSIKALLHSRQRSQRYKQSSTANQMVTVLTMETTPGHDDLPGVSRECEAIEDACSGNYSCRAHSQPDVQLALKSIAGSDIVHFACHGASNIRNPIESHLLLQKNGNSAAVDKLSVSKIMGLETSHFAWISYLSACSTAESRAAELADESLHLSSAFQLAGFAHVIASRWRVDDTICVDVASSFYKNLIAKPDKLAQNRAVAEALREAILHVRARHSTPWKWAAYIHSGA